jgi:hypothetical protein
VQNHVIDYSKNGEEESIIMHNHVIDYSKNDEEESIIMHKSGVRLITILLNKNPWTIIITYKGCKPIRCQNLKILQTKHSLYMVLQVFNKQVESKNPWRSFLKTFKNDGDLCLLLSFTSRMLFDENTICSIEGVLNNISK